MNPPPNKDFREFVLCHADRIYNHAFRMLGSRADAEEAVQDVFLKVYNSLADFRGEADIRTWLYRITVNTCLTRLRRTWRAELHPDGDESGTGNAWDSVVGDEDNPEDILMGNTTKELVTEALGKISTEDREILLLFHVDELRYEEIAKVLGIPLGTVCARLYRARKRLAAVLFSVHKELTR